MVKEWENEDTETVGVLSLVYDHETRELTEKLNAIQHEQFDLVVASTHVHLDAHNCLEVIILKGSSGLIRKISDRLLITKNVKHGRLITTTTGVNID
jgi:CopG family nickel-responsive transcriptional regulator